MSRVYAPNQEYLGTGLVKAYDGDFLIQSLEHLLVIQVDDAGAEVIRVRGSDVTDLIESVEWDDSGLVAGFTVNLLVELPFDYRLIFLLAPDTPDQSFEFADKDSFTLRQIEAALDWLQGQIQRLFYWGFRSLKLSDLDDPTEFDMTLPSGMADESNKLKIPQVKETYDAFQMSSPEDILAGVAANSAEPFTIEDSDTDEPIDDMIVYAAQSSAQFTVEVQGTGIAVHIPVSVNKLDGLWSVSMGPALGDGDAEVTYDVEDETAEDAQIIVTSTANVGDRTMQWKKVGFDAIA